MREILFRGKDTLGHWLYGGFHLWETRQLCVMDDKLKPEEIKHIIIQNSFADWNMPRTMQPYIVIPETVGQYTGLTDKNGTKIFEGDIVKIHYDSAMWGNNREVVFEEGQWFFKDNTISQKSYIGAWGNSVVEVIGNIHDNPELIKECNR